jgi:hypothetical protein
MILQSECIENGFRYEKTWGMHIHQLSPKKKFWKYEGEIARMMQWKGFIKYTNPIKLNLFPCLSAIHICKKEYGLEIKDVIEFCKEHDSKWIPIVLEEFKKIA